MRSVIEATAAKIAQDIIKLGEWKGKGYESEIIRIATDAISVMVERSFDEEADMNYHGRFIHRLSEPAERWEDR